MSLASLRRAWNSDSSPIALRTKQLIAFVVPERLLLQIKKPYYVALLRKDGDETMESDARALPQLIQPGDFVVDVGAFVGFYTKRLSRLVGPGGMVWSFEPLPPTFEILSTVTKRLRLTNVQLFSHAVSDTEGTGTMEIPRFRNGGESWWDARLVRQGPRKASYRRFEITTRTLDSLLAGSDQCVTFIKIDAEYHELRCVRGAVETVRRWHPAMLVETLTSVDDPGSDLHSLVELLASLGYTPYRFDGTTLHKRQPGEKQQNLFFLTEQHLAAAAARRSPLFRADYDS